MKSKNKICCFFVLISILFLSGCTSTETSIEKQQVNEFKNFQPPVYMTAVNIKEKFYKKHLIKKVRYNIKMTYPAEEIIKFYDDEMSNNHFEPFFDSSYKENNRKWNSYVDGTIEDEPYVIIHNMSWTNQNQTQRATLVLKYYWRNKEKRIVLNDNQDLNVEFRIQPFYMEPPQK
ncbi:MAG: hypothetical protein JEZ12_08060 [Desulfobacterium sp.]|nr:hypothetical protein [Desulfobacterium sp.]